MTPSVIFDMDGTLLDSVDLHAQAWLEAFRHFGYDFDYARIRSQIGKGGDQLLPVFLNEEQLRRQAKQIVEFRSALFKEKYLEQVRPFPAVRELFLKLRSNEQRIALASSAKGDELKTFEKIAHIDDVVDAETSSADAERSKPHPDIFEAALARLGDPPHADVVVVGDSPHDAEAAGKAGLKTVGVLCGGFAEEDLRAAGCIAIYRGPEHLLDDLDRSPLAPKGE